MRKKTGFTLIELLVVMAIMGILTIITVSQFTTARIKARDSQRKADLSSVSKALLMYYADYNVFPASNASGQIVVRGTAIAWGGEFNDNPGVAGAYVYMKQTPQENSRTSDCPYFYISNGTNKFALLGCLENAQDQDAKLTAQQCNSKPAVIPWYNFGFVSPNIAMSEVINCSVQ